MSGRGESDVSTFNVAAIGGEEDIARMHADEIAKFLADGNVQANANAAPGPAAGVRVSP